MFYRRYNFSEAGQFMLAIIFSIRARERLSAMKSPKDKSVKDIGVVGKMLDY